MICSWYRCSDRIIMRNRRSELILSGNRCCYGIFRWYRRSDRVFSWYRCSDGIIGWNRRTFILKDLYSVFDIFIIYLWKNIFILFEQFWIITIRHIFIFTSWFVIYHSLYKHPENIILGVPFCPWYGHLVGFVGSLVGFFEKRFPGPSVVSLCGIFGD